MGFTVLAGAALTIVSCGGGEGPIVPRRSEPFLYVVLNQHALQTTITLGKRQRALFMTVGAPTSSDYLVADAFEMRRVSDGALFVWRDEGNRGSVPQGTALHHGNYALLDTAVGGSLGARDIAPGDSFDLTLQAGGMSIRGGVRVPAAFTITVEQRGSNRVVTWAHVVGAESYSVEVSGRTAPRFQTDTSFTLPVLPAAGAVVHVRAVDRNLTRYVTDRASARAGINIASGVFGAIKAESLFVAAAGVALTSQANTRARLRSPRQAP